MYKNIERQGIRQVVAVLGNGKLQNFDERDVVYSLNQLTANHFEDDNLQSPF